MRVRMLHGVSGGINLIPGQEHDFADDEAVRLIEAGFAVPVGRRAIETPEKPEPTVERRAPIKRPAKKPAKRRAKK